jgi:hypothetical protein
MRSLSLWKAGMAALVLGPLSAAGHHGWGGNTEDLELSGTVIRTVSLAGPHASMQIEAEDGQVWDVTLAPAPRTHRAGLDEDVIPVGARVTVSGRRNNNASVFEVKTRRVTWEGRNFDVY